MYASQKFVLDFNSIICMLCIKKMLALLVYCLLITHNCASLDFIMVSHFIKIVFYYLSVLKSLFNHHYFFSAPMRLAS